MGAISEVLKGAASLAVKAAAEVVKAGYQVGKASGEGVVSGTTAIVKEIVKKATGK